MSFVYFLCFLLFFCLFYICFYMFLLYFSLFHRFFIYILPSSYGIILFIFTALPNIFPYFPNEFSFLNNFPPTYMYKLNNIDFCIPEMFCILPSPMLE